MEPFFLALVVKKAEYDALTLENCMPSSLTNNEKKEGSSSPSTRNLIIATMSKSVGLMVGKGKMKPFIKIA